MILFISTLSYVFSLNNIIFAFNDCESISKKYNNRESLACISTNVGLMVVELFPDAAPEAVNRFKELAKSNFYKDLKFYRVVKNFVIQAGIQDFYTINQGFNFFDSSINFKVNYYLSNKFNVEVNFDSLELSTDVRNQLKSIGINSNSNLKSRKFDYGSLGFANKGDTDPNSNTTEFFIVVGNIDNENIKYLNGRFTNFGKVIDGLDVLNKIANSEVDYNNSLNRELSSPKTIFKILEVKVF